MSPALPLTDQIIGEIVALFRQAEDLPPKGNAGPEPGVATIPNTSTAAEQGGRCE